MTWARAGGLRAFELGTPGPMRHRLNARVLKGEKVATAGLWQQDYLDEHESIDEAGERQALLDDDGDVVAVVEVTRAETHRFVDVPWEFADAEGEDFRSIQHWHDGHTSYYAQQGIEIREDTLFRVRLVSPYRSNRVGGIVRSQAGLEPEVDQGLQQGQPLLGHRH
jgi:uncharacterized protein YhfF